MTITVKEFENKVLEILNKHGYSTFEEIKKLKYTKTSLHKIAHEVFLDEDLNTFLRRPVEIINATPQFESEYEKELYLADLIPYRYISEKKNSLIEGITANHTDNSCFNGKYGQSLLEKDGFANYKNIHFYGRIDSLKTVVRKLKEIAVNTTEIQETQYYIGHLELGEHFSALVFTIQQGIIKSTWIDSRIENLETPLLFYVKSNILDIETRYMFLGIQTESSDNNCSICGLNIKKAVARIGLSGLPFTQESLINELTMYYSDGIRRSPEEIQEYHFRERWEVGNQHLENILKGSINKIWLSKVARLDLEVSNNNSIDEMQEMKKFIFGVNSEVATDTDKKQIDIKDIREPLVIKDFCKELKELEKSPATEEDKKAFVESLIAYQYKDEAAFSAYKLGQLKNLHDSLEAIGVTFIGDRPDFSNEIASYYNDWSDVPPIGDSE
ncbi:MAG: hypothetical protein J0M23_04970 [Rickettsiales bacterium]|nr:hypothetical protein [Rickettsiales bacterium]